MLGDVKAGVGSTIELLGFDQQLKFEQQPDRIEIKFPSMSKFVGMCGKQCMPAYTLKLQNISPRICQTLEMIEIDIA